LKTIIESWLGSPTYKINEPKNHNHKKNIKTMEIKLSENYTIELEVTQSNCFGRIFHPGVLHYRNKIGYFIASIIEENETFVKCLMIDLSLRSDLKFDSKKNISIDASDPKGFAGPNESLLEELTKYQASNMPGYSSNLPNYIVGAIQSNFNNSLPVGLNLWGVSKHHFLEFGHIWKDGV
jgi:hypothetical protein